MPAAPYKHPAYFVACPYTPKKRFKRFRMALESLPIEFHFADSAVRTRQLLDRIRSYITRVDGCFFDITGWNANVTLELGLAEGIGKDYYILFKRRGGKSKPPSDLEGIQRFEYTRFDSFGDRSLVRILTDHIVKRLTHPRYVYDNLSGTGLDKEKKFLLAMRMLAHFKRNKFLHRTDITGLRKGTYLRDPAITEVLRVLRQRRLLKGRLDGQRWELAKSLYKRLSA